MERKLICLNDFLLTIDKNRCFWCSKTLKKSKNGLLHRTKDHFLSKFIRKFIAKDLKACQKCKYTISCYHCNQLRGKLQSLFELIWRNKYNMWEQWGAGTPPASSKISNRAKATYKEVNIHIFKKRIKTYLNEEELKRICLMEVEEILKVVADSEKQIAK